VPIAQENDIQMNQLQAKCKTCETCVVKMPKVDMENSTVSYLERLKPLTRTGTWYSVAQLLGTSSSTIDNYRRGTRALDAFAAFRIAELLDLPVCAVMATAELERTKNPDRIAYWKGQLEAVEAYGQE
jgi:transcriptional regulator with XRE-family HTH domain